MSGTSWAVRVDSGSAAEFHGREPAAGGGREVWVFRVARPTFVLGSTQPEGDVDAAAAARGGVDVVRRRSGGGGVLLVPGQAVWIDVVVPRGDVLWDDDVSRAAWWLGEAWVVALEALGVSGATVHRGALQRTPWSDRVCFAGLGPGEVTVGGRKVVGVSQRRARGRARLQSAALLHWAPTELVGLLAPRGGGDPDPAPLAATAVGLDELTAGSGAAGRATAAAVEAAMLAALTER